MSNYTVSIDGTDFPLTTATLDALDAIQLSDGSYHVTHRNQGYRVTVDRLDTLAKQMTLTINGRRIDLRLADDNDLMVKSLGFATEAVTANQDLHAPMPGLVLKMLVSVGDEISAGTPLLILEAMKMENVLKAEADGRIESIEIIQGQAVDKRQLLIKFA